MYELLWDLSQKTGLDPVLIAAALTGVVVAGVAYLVRHPPRS